MISKSRIQGPVHELDSMVVGELLDDQWIHASQKFRGNFAAEISRSQLGEHIFFEVNKFQKGSGLTNQNRAISIKIITNCINLHLVFRSFSLFGLFH